MQHRLLAILGAMALVIVGTSSLSATAQTTLTPWGNLTGILRSNWTPSLQLARVKETKE